MIKEKALSKGKEIQNKKNEKMKKTIDWIPRIVININAFNGQTIGEKSGNIKHQAQQFKKGKKKERVCGKWNGNNSDIIPQKLYIERRHEDYLLVFATKNGRIGGVLFVVDVASNGRVENDGKKGRIYKIIINVANKKWKKTKVGHKADELNNEKMNK